MRTLRATRHGLNPHIGETVNRVCTTVGGIERDDNSPDIGTGEKRPQGVLHERRAGDLPILLGNLSPEATSRPRRGYDCPDTFHGLSDSSTNW